MKFKKVLLPFGMLLSFASCASSKNLESDKPMPLPLAQQTPLPSSANPAAPAILPPTAAPTPVAATTPTPSTFNKSIHTTCVGALGTSLTFESPGYEACLLQKNKNSGPQK